MKDLFDLTGRVALITGSSRGIGRAIAEAMVAHGATVVISSRKLEACMAVADELNARYGEGSAIAVAANISRKEELAELVKRTRASFGQIDILVCNAATNPHYGSLLDITDEQFHKVLDNNILSNHWLVQMIAPEMIERRDGSIIIVSSIGGLTGSSTLGAYNVSKAADFQLARNLAAELGAHRIRVNCIAPGLVRTDFARALWEDSDKLRLVTQGVPLGRIGEPEEIAGAAVFLAGRAASFLTGQAIVVDGGVMVNVTS